MANSRIFQRISQMVFNGQFCPHIWRLISKSDESSACLSPFFPSTVSMNSISSDRTFQKLRALLKDCEESHSLCKDNETPNPPKLPNRVLYVTSDAKGFAAHLHISNPNERGRYLALSYCWGGPQKFTTTSKTLESMTLGIPSTELPKTILDAITVTRKLGMQYLWIDSLCIVQDNTEDKINEIMAMGDIYKNATLTIAAANAEKVDDGFLSDRPPLKLCPVPFHLSPKVLGTIYLANRHRSRRLEGSLFTRGWAFQEFLLSPRILLYDSIQVTFICATWYPGVGKGLHSGLTWYLDASKTYFDNLTNSNYRPGTPGSSIASLGLNHHWTILIKGYSSRDFTNFEDRLPAIAGIARVFSHIWKDEYVAGLWRGPLINQLGWYRARGYRYFSSEQHLFEPFSQITERIGWPSWSWKSAPFSIDFSDIKLPTARVIGYNIKLASTAAPFGDVLEGILKLRANWRLSPWNI
jgi:hypothetical protein